MSRLPMSRTQRDWVIALELRIMNDRWALNNDLREDTDSIENLPELIGFFHCDPVFVDCG